MYFMYYVKVTCVRFDDHRIVSGSVDRMIKMWDVRTGKLVLGSYCGCMFMN